MDQVNLGPRHRMPHERLHAVLDAAAVLQVRRSELASALERGQACGAWVVARGLSAVNDWIREDIKGWRDLLSVRPSATVAELRVSVPYNRQLVENGLRMVSLFDWYGLDPASRQLLAGEQLGDYRLGVAPVQMKIVDRRNVLLQGPFVDGEMTLMVVTASDCMAAAWQYWHAALAGCYPAAEERRDLRQLTHRQRQVAALLAEDARDEVIAETLGVSVRTVRADVARLMDALGVRSRFAAGARFAELSGER
ncbi:helix-turn-helix transcriptional regulator [Nocardioides sp.]|uniref:helix-turn-helix transcriptional regulator n=1 Tax=Nocardioides sp. TaxID=35761 RepID=UPI0025F36A9A|nr:helix-turn-helix transcriptional regulator [Nocardioides sp.]